MRKVLFAAGFIGLMLGGPAAHADLLYTLNLSGCSGGCSPAPFATVDLTQVNSTTVSVTETLENGAKFVATGAGDALEFNIQGKPTIAVTDLTTGFAVDNSASITASTFGTFDYGIVCTVPTGCGHGASDPNSGPLLFSTTDGSALSITDFIANTGGYFFASDVIAGNGKTGNVASNGPGTCTTDCAINPTGGGSVPEPASLTLLGLGLAAVGLVRRRRLR